MALYKAPKSMAEVREWRRTLFAKAKGKTMGEKMAWISKHAKMLSRPYIDPLTQFKKASQRKNFFSDNSVS